MIRWVHVGELKTIDPEEAAKKLLTSYDHCPRCDERNRPNLSHRIYNCKIRTYYRWHLGLFRSTIVTMEGECSKCKSKWVESKSIPGEFTFRPIQRCLIYWIIMLIALCITIPTLAWCIHTATIPAVERDVTNGKYLCVLMPALVGIAAIIFSIVRIIMKTINTNRYHNRR